MNFNLEEANNSLVFVKPVVQDIQDAWAQIKLLKLQAEQNGEYYEKELTTLMKKIEYNMQELQQTGAILKDLDEGLVDFPSFYKNEPIYLCWKIGETRIDFWHFQEEGINGRVKIDEEFSMLNSKNADLEISLG
jgi:hypothetical protein